MLEQHAITVSSPLNHEVNEFLQGLVFRSMVGHEALGRPFKYKLQLLSMDRNLQLGDVLGKPITVTMEVTFTETRHFNGFVTDFELVGSVGEFALYEAEIDSFLWFLSNAQNCRIFQQMPVVEIVREVCRKYGFTDIDATALSGNYLERAFVVQYNETDFNFVSRLLEQEGIYYFFRHEETKHTLVLADSLGAHEATSGCEELPFRPPDSNRVVTGDCIDSWRFGKRVTSDLYSVKDYDFERPAASLLAPLAAPDVQSLEVFEYAAAYPYLLKQEQELLRHHNEDPRDLYVRVRLEKLQARAERAIGRTNARRLLVGAIVGMRDFPRDDQNRRYLVTSAKYVLRGQDLRSAGGSEGAQHQCTFRAHDVRRPFRPPQVAKKTRILGPQSARVVGKDGEEIWTDEYGRVKILFAWDRFGSGFEDSSCWVRVAQIWAGAKMGGIYIPRIGDEVIVEFLDGDPDRPIITGRVYNADNMPPYRLPENQTQSGLKTRSTKGGEFSNANEMRFEDKKGQEELYIQAERNYTELVKNDKSVNVQANRSTNVGGNDSVSVTGDRSISVDGNLSVTVKGGGQSPVHSTQSITGKHSLDASDTIEVTAPTHIKLAVAGSSILIEPGKITVTAGDGASVVLDANVLAASKGQSEISLKGGAATVTAKEGASLALTAKAITSSKDGSTVSLDSNVAVSSGASVDVSGKEITVGGNKVALSGGTGTVELAAAGATVSGNKVGIAGSGVTEITGAMVKIN